MIPRSKIFILLLLLGWLHECHAEAQEVALLISREIPPYLSAAEGFKKSCGSKYAEYSLGGDPAKASEVFKDIRNNTTLRLVVAVGTEALESAMSQSTLPIVYTMVLEPKQHRKEMTGISLEIPPATQLKVLRQAVPGAKTMGIIYNPATSQAMHDGVQAACQAAGLALVAAPVASDREVTDALKKLAGKIDALWMLPDPSNISPQGSEAILLFGLENKVPILAPSEKFVKNGALLSVAADYQAVGEQTGRMANAIVRGTPTSGLPTEQPQKFTLSINLKVAKQVGLTIPGDILKQASKTYQ